MTSEAIRTRDQPTCPVTGQGGDVLYENLSDHLWGAPGAWRLRANLSGSTPTAWLDPMPIEADLHVLYRHYYTHSQPPGRWSSLNPARFLIRAAFAIPLRWTGLYRERIAQMYLRLRDRRPGRVLDVGCGRGDRLAALRDIGWQAVGQEIDPAAAEEARRRHGLMVHVGDLATLPIEPRAFDAVTLSHVVEHVPDPVGLLVRCRELLRPGGLLICMTPNVCGYGHRVWGRHWRGLEPPRHLQLFSVGSLRHLAERSGLVNIRVSTTAALGEFIASQSIALAAGRKDVGTEPPDLGVEVRSKLHQLAAWYEHRRDPTCGDELVLEADVGDDPAKIP